MCVPYVLIHINAGKHLPTFAKYLASSLYTKNNPIRLQQFKLFTCYN